MAAAAALYFGLSEDDGVVLTPGDTYVEGVAGSWQRVNPLFSTTNEVDQDLVSLVFSGLLRVGPDGQLEPDLAAALPGISEDGRTYTFRLRPGLSWQDGVALTSRDVAFTISRLTEPDFKGDPPLAEPWSGVEVETPDASTVVFRLRQASAPFLARNGTIGILPEHLLGAAGGAALFESPFNTAPIGSGPYRLQSLDTREATLAANERYHFGKPAIATLRIRFYPDYQAAIRGLATAEVNGLLVRETLSDAQALELGRIKGVKVDQFQRAAYILLYLNNDQAMFQPAGVRRAISLALERRAIVDSALARVATASASAIAPGTWAYEEEYDATASNVAEARKLLEVAGWKANPSTGILTKEGQEFRFTIRTDNDPLRVAVAGEVAKQLEALGIRATVASTTFSVLRRDFLQERKYDAAVAGWDQGADPDPYFGWHSSQLGTAGLNIANFGDVVVDELIARARTTNDSEVRKELYRQFQEKWEELTPSVVVAYPRYLYVHSDGLKGLLDGVLSTPSQRFYDVHTWTK